MLTGSFLAVLSITFLPVFVSAQYRSTVTGYVFGPQRVRVDGARVELQNDLNSTISRTQTDSSGRYFFSGVPSGRLAVRVLPLGTDLGEQTQEFEIRGVGVRGQPIPENVQLDFYLRPRRTPDAVVNAVVFAQDVPDEARSAYVEAVSDLDGKRVLVGIEGLKKALNIFPTYFLALDRLAQEYMKQEKFAEAGKMFAAAVAVNSKSYSSWYGLAFVNYAAENFPGAMEAATKALVLDKNAASALFVLGVSERRLKFYDQAEKTLLKAKRFDKGKTPEIYWNLALLYAHNLNRPADAAVELELFLKATPDNPDAENIKKLIKQFRERRPAK